MTNLELTRRAIALLAAGTPSSPWWEMEAEVSSCIPYAMQELANAVAADHERYGLLMQDYSVTLTNGAGNLLTVTGAVTSAADILWRSVAKGIVKDAYGERLHYVPDAFTFEGAQLAGYNLFTLVNPNILVRTPTGPFTLGNVADPLSIKANFIPTVTTVPEELEDDAVRLLAKIAAQKIGA